MAEGYSEIWKPIKDYEGLYENILHYVISKKCKGNN